MSGPRACAVRGVPGAVTGEPAVLINGASVARPGRLSAERPPVDQEVTVGFPGRAQAPPLKPPHTWDCSQVGLSFLLLFLSNICIWKLLYDFEK